MPDDKIRKIAATLVDVCHSGKGTRRTSQQLEGAFTAVLREELEPLLRVAGAVCIGHNGGVEANSTGRSLEGVGKMTPGKVHKEDAMLVPLSYWLQASKKLELYEEMRQELLSLSSFARGHGDVCEIIARRIAALLSRAEAIEGGKL